LRAPAGCAWSLCSGIRAGGAVGLRTAQQARELWQLHTSGLCTQAMAAGDAGARWIMQAWLFYNEKAFWGAPQIKARPTLILPYTLPGHRLEVPANDHAPRVKSGPRAGVLPCDSCRSAAPQGLISGVPTGALVMLDLYADVNPQWARTDGFYGAPFIWCMLHNFGGNLGARRAAPPPPPGAAVPAVAFAAGSACAARRASARRRLLPAGGPCNESAAWLPMVDMCQAAAVKQGTVNKVLVARVRAHARANAALRAEMSGWTRSW